MIPVLAYVSAGAFVAGLGLGGYLGGQLVGPRQHDLGWQAGVEEQKLKCAKDMDGVRSEARAQANEELRKAEARANEIQRIQQAAIEAARVEHAQASAAATADGLRLLGRVRDEPARNPVRRANGSGGVSEAACNTRRDDATAEARLLLERAGADLVRLATRADTLSAQYALCLKSLPGATP